MKILALSGSGRHASTNTAFLRGLENVTSSDPEFSLDIIVFDGVSALPVFSPDLETGALPGKVRDFTNLIRDQAPRRNRLPMVWNTRSKSKHIFWCR